MNGYRQSPFANITPVVKNLLIINLIFFLAYLLFDRNDPRGPVTTIFGSFYFDSPHFKPWQFLTYMFMHGGFEHILFNMFALFSFGPILEYFLGSKRFFTLYIIAGLGAGILQMTVQAIEVHNMIGTFTVSGANINISQSQVEALYGIYNYPLVGASGAIFGLLVAFGMIYPNLELMILFIPVPVKAKYLIPVYIIIELISGFGQFTGDNVAHFAHLGGALIGFIMIKIWRLKEPEAF